ncbi:hypothetical protein [Bacillus paranthracis]|uniref:hypothetical protein n=1 Tax=Bacillus cereus group TaxID=86661 RepID=UPI000A382143|nr:hypothetical protein BK786_08790 [Bacillus thuringiensis serovar thailandensis]
MICNECGSNRIGNAKFCGECGSKFKLSNKEMLDLEQQKILRMINSEKNLLTDSILAEGGDNRSILAKRYIQYINSVRSLLDFNENNAELIADLIIDHQDSDAFYAQLFEELGEENPYFQDELDLITNVHTWNKQKNKDFDFEEFYKDQHKHFNELIAYYKESEMDFDMNCSEEIREFTLRLENLEMLKNLHENEKLLDFIRFRYKFTGGQYNLNLEKNATKTQLDINTDNPNFKNDVIDLVDAALAFTSPISATRYVLKKMKS